MQKLSIKNYLLLGSAFYRSSWRHVWSPSNNRSTEECRGPILLPPPQIPVPRTPPPPPASSLLPRELARGAVADLYCLGSICQVAGRSPDVRVVPSFTKRAAGNTTLVQEHHRGGEVERCMGSGVVSAGRGPTCPTTPRGLSPPGSAPRKNRGQTPPPGS